MSNGDIGATPGETVKITTEQELQPFRVPNFVLALTKPRPRQEGIVEGPKFALHELSDDVLEALCKRFRDDVFAKARSGADGDSSP